jgi:hypothetical protein
MEHESSPKFKYFLSTSFPNTLDLCYSLVATEQDSHRYETTDT